MQIAIVLDPRLTTLEARASDDHLAEGVQ